MEFCEILTRYKNKKITFIGVGISNTPIIFLFAKNGIAVTVRDKKPIESQLRDKLEAFDIPVIEGEAYLDDINEDMVFISPGVKLYPELLEAQKRGCVLTGEMAEFFSFCPCKTICITGSDGKTTTSTLIAKILEAQGETVYLGGNIGKNLFMELPNIKPDDYAVIELSSFQLMKLTIAPDIAVVTNISPNHLDWHKDMAEYIEAKKRIFSFQKNEQILVLNYDNTICRQYADEAVSTVRFFSRQDDSKGYFFDGKFITKNNKQMLDCGNMLLPGVHNRENMMAAIAATEDFVSSDSIASVAESFPGVEHRCEFVRELEGVKYYNSSIDSSPTRTKAAIESFNCPLIVIAGGYDKNLPVEELGDVFKAKVHTVILLGATTPKLAGMLNDCNYKGIIIKAKTMNEAVTAAKRAAKSGDCVILSPAAASFDMFKNFDERGKVFKNEVNNLKKDDTV